MRHSNPAAFLALAACLVAANAEATQNGKKGNAVGGGATAATSKNVFAPPDTPAGAGTNLPPNGAPTTGTPLADVAERCGAKVLFDSPFVQGSVSDDGAATPWTNGMWYQGPWGDGAMDVGNGVLTIRGVHEGNGSDSLSTINRQGKGYRAKVGSYSEMIAKLGGGPGTQAWNGFWLYGYEHAFGGAEATEFDGPETQGNQPHTLFLTVHRSSGGNGRADQQNTDNAVTVPENIFEGVHTYGILWPADQPWIGFTFDGRLVKQVPKFDNSDNYTMMLNITGGRGNMWQNDAFNGTMPVTTVYAVHSYDISGADSATVGDCLYKNGASTTKSTVSTVTKTVENSPAMQSAQATQDWAAGVLGEQGAAAQATGAFDNPAYSAIRASSKGTDSPAAPADDAPTAFADEFTGNRLDAAKWKGGGGGAAAAAAAVSGRILAASGGIGDRGNRDVGITDGVLHMTTAATAQGDDTTSSDVIQSAFAGGPGYYEVRAKLAGGAGLRSAVKLMPDDGVSPQQVTIAESYGSTTGTTGSQTRYYYFGGVSTNGDSSSMAEAFGDWAITQTDMSAGFHTFGVNISADGTMGYYLDRQPVTGAGNLMAPADFTNRKWTLQLSLGVGGSPWSQTGSTGTQQNGGSGDFAIDYARIYKEMPPALPSSSADRSAAASLSGGKP